MGPLEQEGLSEGRGSGGRPRRWVCRCSEPPVLLATLEGNQINLKIRDRYYHIEGLHGRVQAICPLCGTRHTITFGGESVA
jgi:hypothetical protein